MGTVVLGVALAEKLELHSFRVLVQQVKVLPVGEALARRLVIPAVVVVVLVLLGLAPQAIQRTAGMVARVSLLQLRVRLLVALVVVAVLGRVHLLERELTGAVTALPYPWLRVRVTLTLGVVAVVRVVALQEWRGLAVPA